MGTRKLVSLDHRESLFTSPFQPLEAQSLFAKRYVEGLYGHHMDKTQLRMRISP